MVVVVGWSWWWRIEYAIGVVIVCTVGEEFSSWWRWMKVVDLVWW